MLDDKFQIRDNLQFEMPIGKMAEREGFEPSVPLAEYASLAGTCLRPLSHLSKDAKYDRIDQLFLLREILEVIIFSQSPALRGRFGRRIIGKLYHLFAVRKMNTTNAAMTVFGHNKLRHTRLIKRVIVFAP